MCAHLGVGKLVWETCTSDPGGEGGCGCDSLPMETCKRVCKTRECANVHASMYTHTTGIRLPSSWKGIQQRSFTPGCLCTPSEPFPDLAQSCPRSGQPRWRAELVLLRAAHSLPLPWGQPDIKI